MGPRSNGSKQARINWSETPADGDFRARNPMRVLTDRATIPAVK